MTQQTINNGETGLVVRGKINDNFTELYGGVTPQPVGILWEEDFTGASYDTDVIKQFFSTISHDTANDRLTLTGTNPAFCLLESALGLVDGVTYTVVIEWDANTGDSLHAYGSWSDSASHRASFVDDDQKLVFSFQQSAGGSGQNYSPVVLSRPADGASGVVYINSIRVYSGVAALPEHSLDSPILIGFDNRVSQEAKNDSVIIGNDIRVVTNSTANKAVVLIGQGIEAEGSIDGCVAIGELATVSFDNSFGGVDSGGLRVAIGERATAACWRATAVGALAHALHTSSTAIGTGACSEVTHGNAFGRGAYIPSESNVQNVAVLADYDLYLGNGPFAHSDSPPSGITISEEAGVDPTTKTARIIGKCALDARATPSDTNVGGGDFAICAGAGIGTGVGGDVLIQTAPAGASGSSQNAWVTAASFDAVATGGSEETRFMLLDLTAGTMKRVSFGADDSGGSGFKVLRVAN
jgi:hypothetical protein